MHDITALLEMARRRPEPDLDYDFESALLLRAISSQQGEAQPVKRFILKLLVPLRPELIAALIAPPKEHKRGVLCLRKCVSRF